MKKILFVFAIAAAFTACNSAETTATVNTDSIAAAAKADSLAKVAAMPAKVDSTLKAVDSLTKKVDSVIKK